MNDDKRPILGISIGDPGGIGPEITAKALNEKNIYELARPVVVGDYRVMEDVLKFTDVKLTLNSVREVQDARGQYIMVGFGITHFYYLWSSWYRCLLVLTL